ncbi:MAG: ADP-ribosylglycohydrolase family protein [Acidimicrobiia bacterium]
MTADIAFRERLAGGLLGLAAGDALGATVEFLPAETIRRRYGRHCEVRGGGAFGWRPGQGTDDTDLAYAVALAYAEGYSLDRVAQHFLAWYRRSPRDIGGTTAAALAEMAHGTDPALCGHRVAGPSSAGNGSLMRCIATGLARRSPSQRRVEAVAISALTHADPRCTQACAAYCDLVSLLVDGATPAEAVETVLASSPMSDDLAESVAIAGGLSPAQLDPSGYVLATLQVGVWAVLQPRPLEDVLVDVVNLGGDADTTGAVAGGLLGVRDGAPAIPARWVDLLEYRSVLLALVPRLAALREGSSH